MRIMILGKGKLAWALYKISCLKGWETQVLSRPNIDANNPMSITPFLKNFIPDIVFNTINYGSIEFCYKNPQDAFKVNTLFPLRIAQLVVESNKIFCHFSSDAVFSGGSFRSPIFFNEEALPLPRSVYGISKYSADLLLLNYISSCYIFRLPIIFGPSPYRNQFVERLIPLGLKKGELFLANDIVISPLYSLDVVSTILNVIVNKFPYGLYHCSNSDITTPYDFFKIIVSLLNIPVRLIAVSHTYFEGNDFRNTGVMLSSNKIPTISSIAGSIKRFCNNYKDYIIGRTNVFEL